MKADLDPNYLWYLLDIGVDFLFLFDVVINLFSAFYDKEENLIIDNKVRHFNLNYKMHR